MAKVIFAEDHSKLETIKVDLREMVQFLREEKSRLLYRRQYANLDDLTRLALQIGRLEVALAALEGI